MQFTLYPFNIYHLINNYELSSNKTNKHTCYFLSTFQLEYIRYLRNMLELLYTEDRWPLLGDMAPRFWLEAGFWRTIRLSLRWVHILTSPRRDQLRSWSSFSPILYIFCIEVYLYRTKWRPDGIGCSRVSSYVLSQGDNLSPFSRGILLLFNHNSYFHLCSFGF